MKLAYVMLHDNSKLKNSNSIRYTRNKNSIKLNIIFNKFWSLEYKANENQDYTIKVVNYHSRIRTQTFYSLNPSDISWL